MITTSPESVGLSQKKLDMINEFTTGYIQDGHLAGTITLVSRRNKIVHFQCSGKLNVETGQDLRADAIFRIYSMTKPVTSLAAMMLYEKGYFDLDTPVSQFLPAFGDLRVFAGGDESSYTTEKPQRPMIMKDLFTHTSGLAYGIIADTPVDRLYLQHIHPAVIGGATLEKVVDKIAEQPLLFSPGQHWCYSVASDVLGRVVEVISGQSLDDFMEQRIFQPLGMVDTGFFVPEHKHPRFKTLYMHRNGMPAEIREQYPDQKLFTNIEGPWGEYHHRPAMIAGGGGLVSTATDYLKFAQMLLNRGAYSGGQLVQPSTIDLMTRNHLDGDMQACAIPQLAMMAAPGVGYGLGLGVILDPSKALNMGNPGAYHWGGAAHTTFFVDPKEELIGIFLTQIFPQMMFDTDLEFRRLVYGAIERS